MKVVNATIDWRTMFGGAQHMDVIVELEGPQGKSALTVMAVATATSATTCDVEWRTLFLHDRRDGLQTRLWPRLVFDQQVLTAMDDAIEQTIHLSHLIKGYISSQRVRDMWNSSIRNPDAVPEGYDTELNP